MILHIIHLMRRRVDSRQGSRGSAHDPLAGNPGGPSYGRRKPPHCPATTYRITGPVSSYSNGSDYRLSSGLEVAA